MEEKTDVRESYTLGFVSAYSFLLIPASGQCLCFLTKRECCTGHMKGLGILLILLLKATAFYILLYDLPPHLRFFRIMHYSSGELKQKENLAF